MPDPVPPVPVVPPVVLPVVPPLPAPPALPVTPPNTEGVDLAAALAKSQADNVAANTRLAALEAAETARKQASMSELEREKAQREEAQTKLAELERKDLARTVAEKHNLSSEARELLSGANVAELEAHALKLASIMKQPVVAGTLTQPGGGAAPTLDQQIAAAEKANNPLAAIRLKRQQAGFQ